MKQTLIAVDHGARKLASFAARVVPAQVMWTVHLLEFVLTALVCHAQMG
jgi:hypothetical protein